MREPIEIFKGTTGLNTVDDPARLPEGDMAEMVNLRVDQSGRPSKRVGITLITADDFHSLYCDKGDCFVAKNRASDVAIYQVAANGSLTGIRSGLQENTKVCFKQSGDKTYYANGVENGIIENGVSSAWSVGEYFGVDTDRSFSIPGGMKHLEIHAGRMFASVLNTVWWSEPFRFDLFDMARSVIQFNSNVRMLKAVTNGLYVSTEKNTYFVVGTNPNEFKQVKIASFPAIEYSVAIEHVEGVEIGLNNSGLCAIWASSEGVIIGTSEGQVLNLNKEKIIYPENVKSGFGCLMGYNFIHGME